MSIGTFTAASGATIPAGTDSVRTSGYANPGDGGGAIYSHEASMPSHPARFQAADGRWFGLDRSQTVRPEMFGAVSSTADATAALQAAIDFASTRGRLVRLSRIYLYSSEIEVRAGVRIAGARGAGLKRIDQVKTTTTSAVAAGSGTRTFTVASAAQFAVGQSVMLVTGATVSPDDPHSHRNPVITAISGNQITIETRSVILAQAAGAELRTATHGLILASGAVVEGIAFDGNAAAQVQPGENSDLVRYRWRTHNEVTIEGDEAVLSSCSFRNAPSDAVLVSGKPMVGTTPAVRQRDSKILGCSFSDIGANAVHYGLTEVSLVEGCTFRRTNTRSTGLNTEHQDGAVIYSDNCTDLTVTGCDFDDCLSGVGSLTTYPDIPIDNDNVLVTGCTFRNCRRPLSVEVETRRIAFVGNRVWAQFPYVTHFDNNSIHIAGIAAARGPREIVIADNQIFNGIISVAHCYGGRIAGNHINLRALQQHAELPKATAILAAQCSDLSICDNTIEGGQVGIQLQNDSAYGDTVARPLLCAGNHVIDQRNVGIRGVVGGAAPGLRALLQGNQVTASPPWASQTAGGYNAMTLQTGMFAIGNKIDVGSLAAFNAGAPAGHRRDNVVNGAFEA